MKKVKIWYLRYWKSQVIFRHKSLKSIKWDQVSLEISSAPTCCLAGSVARVTWGWLRTREFKIKFELSSESALARAPRVFYFSANKSILTHADIREHDLAGSLNYRHRKNRLNLVFLPPWQKRRESKKHDGNLWKPGGQRAARRLRENAPQVARIRLQTFLEVRAKNRSFIFGTLSIYYLSSSRTDNITPRSHFTISADSMGVLN